MSVSTFSNIFFYFFCGLSILTLIALIVKTVSGAKAGLLKKGLLFVFVWLVSSVFIFVVSGIYFIGANHTLDEAPTVKLEFASVSLIVLSLLWLGLGFLLVKNLRTPERINLK